MKIRRILSSKWFRFGVPVLLLLVLLGARQWQQSVLASKYVINPVTGQYDPDLSAWVLPITSSGAGTVEIELGDRAGEANSIQEDVLFLLSPMLRKHPEEKVFIVSWGMACCSDGGTSDGGQNLTYHRDMGEVTYHRQGWFASKPYDTTTVVAQGVDDLQIHRLAALNRPYTELGK